MAKKSIYGTRATKRLKYIYSDKGHEVKLCRNSPLYNISGDFLMDFGVKNKVKNDSVRELYSRAVSKAENMVSEFQSNNIITEDSTVFFDLLLSINTQYADGCGGCLGFQCIGCWRGFIVVFAHRNEHFYNYLRSKSMTENIMDGVDKYDEYIKNRK